MIKKFENFVTEGIKTSSMNMLEMTLRMFSFAGNLICFIGDEETINKFAEAMEERKELLNVIKDGIYSYGIDMSEFGYDDLGETTFDNKKKIAVFINSDKIEDEKVKELILKASMKMDLDKIEFE